MIIIVNLKKSSFVTAVYLSWMKVRWDVVGVGSRPFGSSMQIPYCVCLLGAAISILISDYYILFSYRHHELLISAHVRAVCWNEPTKTTNSVSIHTIPMWHYQTAVCSSLLQGQKVTVKRLSRDVTGYKEHELVRELRQVLTSVSINSENHILFSKQSQ